MSADRPRRFRFSWPVVAALVALATVGVLALLVNIFERKAEARDPFYRVVALTDSTDDPAVWGKNFPLQYDDYLRTVDQVRTRYGGSEAITREPTADDPREVTAQSRLESDPRLVRFWSGYAFAEDFREERGHAYMLSDQVFTRRQVVAKQPGTCLHCHASVYVPYTKAGDGDLMRGFEALNQMPFMDARELVDHPVSCIDCHDPETMQLRVTRPGFIEGIRVLKASEGIDDYDVNVDATRLEMRTYVCGQCHVEYYFKGPEKRLTYPWHKGLKADSMLAYYDEVGFSDWTHKISGAPTLKAQHPEFELFSQGTHAQAGVSCADCHMPYKREGAMKVSDHWVRSPLLNVQNACQTCHRRSEDDLLQRVYEIQDRTYGMRNLAIDAVLQLTDAIAEVAAADPNAPGLAVARHHQRRGQFLTDFIEAENSMGFHADQEAMRVLANAINEVRLGQAALRGERLPGMVTNPLIPTPANPPAQATTPVTATALVGR